jgi:hypothetical protein
MYLDAEPDRCDHRRFYQGLAELAARRRIGDWEARSHIWRGVGHGLAVAELDALSYRRQVQCWSRGNVAIVELMAQGYAAVPRDDQR